MTAIQPNGRVYSLDLFGAKFNDYWLGRLNYFGGLRSLTLYGTGVSEEGLSRSLILEQLLDLSIFGGIWVTDKTLERLAKLPQLREVTITYAVNVTDEAVRRLRVARPNLMISIERPALE